eukprot:1315104-Amphidinium_carterae.4
MLRIASLFALCQGMLLTVQGKEKDVLGGEGIVERITALGAEADNFLDSHMELTILWQAFVQAITSHQQSVKEKNRE